MHIVFNITERIVSGSTQRLEASVKLLHEKVDRIMAKITDVDTLLDSLNTATNDVAADLDAQRAELKALRDQIAAGTPVSQAQLDAVALRLSTNVARLQVLAADVDNPVPAPVDPNPPVPANG